MLHSKSFLLFSLTALTFSFSAALHADPVAELAKISEFKNVNPAKLANGEVLAARGANMGFSRGLSAQVCYVVMAPVKQTLELHENWTPTNNRASGVYLHGNLGSDLSPTVFAKKIVRAPSNSAVRSLVATTEKLNPQRLKLYMSKAEATKFQPSREKSRGAMPMAVSEFWSQLLSQRAEAFAKSGFSGEPSYDYHGDRIRPANDAEQLLREVPKIRSQFSSLTHTAMRSGRGASLYWELDDVDREAAFSLGAFFKHESGSGWQALDAHYYSSGGYFVMLTYYQMWPVQIQGKAATLVWRCDLLASPQLAGLHGIEKLASSSQMLRDIKKSTQLFLKDIRR